MMSVPSVLLKTEPTQREFYQLLQEADNGYTRIGAQQKKYTSIELFAGAGGLALGLEQAGFHHLGLVEFNKAAAATLKHNRSQWRVM